MNGMVGGSNFLSSKGRLVRGTLAVLVVTLLLPAAYSAIHPQTVGLEPGTVEAPADEVTYVSIQGFHFAGYGDPKKPARLVAANADAEPRWSFDGDDVGAFWFYDVDPLENGNLFVVSTYPDRTIVFEFDPAAERAIWTYELDAHDTHDVTVLDDDRVLVANMRHTDGGESDDRLYVENTSTGETEWTWRFRDHYPEDTDGGYDDDWTHVNDVDVLDDEGRYVMASPRNFDQVIVVDRRTDDIVMRLGEDDDHDTLYEQHNPDYLERDDGTPVILVADSENDRVVEYERDCGGADPALGAGTPPEDCTWERVWTVDGFNWPRDADRLPNGNTLVTDSLNHRVVEITPEGEVAWEFFASWGPYEAERGEKGSNGPTMSDQDVEGSFTVHGGSEESPATRYGVPDAIVDVGTAVGAEETATEVASTYAHYEPWIRPAWMESWTALSTAAAGLLAILWGAVEAVVRRDRIRSRVR